MYDLACVWLQVRGVVASDVKTELHVDQKSSKSSNKAKRFVKQLQEGTSNKRVTLLFK